MSNLHHIMDDVIQESFGDNGILKHFTRVLMGADIASNGRQFSPDINGYTVTFIQPPDLSGYELNGTVESVKDITKMFPFLCIDFTPPPTQVIASEIPARSGSIQFGTEVQSSGQMQITCMDDSELGLAGFIKTWVSYIEDVTRGIVDPHSKYTDPYNKQFFGALDYATSAYVIRFKPTAKLDWGDIVYIGKAVGIFPLNIPDKEIIGRRDNNEITMLPISFTCTFYRQAIYGSLKEVNSWIVDEFTDKCKSMFP